jgi:molecular chaperone GrpE
VAPTDAASQDVTTIHLASGGFQAASTIMNANGDTTFHDARGVDGNESSQSESWKQEIDSGRARIATLEAERVVMSDHVDRLEAEVATIRDRSKRNVEETRQFAVQRFATDVAEAAENLRRGLASIPKSVEHEPEVVTRLREGFIAVERSFIDLLKRNGIERTDPTGTLFDPEHHQAMAQQESSLHPSGTVLHSATSAWTLNGRLLRPAMVVVAKGPSSHGVADG